ncbi:hypothetical protein Tco_1113052 [Tanacetum coccineum]|uniref:Uncharacterized protein n=1 Tax=Tanacetum coccineum TaxID=301880 RepID=A0ABQ5IUS1_9ASTR
MNHHTLRVNSPRNKECPKRWRSDVGGGEETLEGRDVGSWFGGMMVNFGFFDGLEMEAFGKAMEVDNGDEKTIPITNTGHSILPTLSRSLYLYNVLVTPNIIKNLIYVPQFTRDNKCTAEFDEFDFSAEDFLTRYILLRCDNSGDLYPVTKPSPIPSAMRSLGYVTWH